MAERVHVYEVGPRDGLQNEATPVSTEQKLALIRGLVEAGVRRIEATSFVSPKAVPQMADAPQVVAGAHAHEGTQFTALIVNEQGYERAVAAGCRAIAMVVVVSETLSRNNSRMSTEQALTACASILQRARKDGVYRRVYLAPAWVCPFEGPVSPDRVVACGDAVWEAGVDELAIADTLGHAHPLEVGRLLERLGARYDMARLAAHLHDTQALGLANAAAALSAGVRTIDSSVGGLGGCPFAPGAAGNLATEDFVLMAHKMGFETGIDLEALWGVVGAASEMVGRRVGGRTRAWWESKSAREAAKGAPRPAASP